MNDEEEIKKRMIEQKMKELAEKESAKHAETAQVQEAVKSMLRHVLDEKARERLNNIRVANPKLASTLEMHIAQAYQTGQLRHRLSETDLVTILRQISPKKNFKITRK